MNPFSALKYQFRRALLCGSLLLVFAFDFLPARAQNSFLPPSDRYRPDRLRTVVITEAATGVVISAGLYFLWYRKHPRSRFHFFNDNGEWLQMDKMGHATTAYNVGTIQYDLMRWCGVDRDPSIAIGSLTALGYMSIIEVLDGFSSKWGFSKGDMLANIFGTALFAAQQAAWNQQRVSLKFSFHPTMYAQYYPAELGKNLISRMLKDYNGQTYWLSFNIASFLPSKTDFPGWLNASVGYGAEGMIGARSNPDSLNGVKIPDFPRYRQFYFAPDADLFRISSNSGFYNAAAYLTRFSKIPAPTLEWNRIKGLKFRPLYY
ncbi:MAG TPA: DUF2279 domain-containing protein [Puia sp.]|nr:DUF2279 domain-containing protein [Puia sp.]